MAEYGPVGRLSSSYREAQLAIPESTNTGLVPVTILDRVAAAYKSWRYPKETEEALKGVQVYESYQSIADWDRRINQALKMEAQASSNPRASSLVFAGYRWLGIRLPEATLRVMEPSKDDDKEATAIPNHPLVQQFKKPNPWCAGSLLWKAFAYSWILNGNVYFIKWRDIRGRVQQIWYEPHFNVRPRTLGDGKGAYLYNTANPELDAPGKLINYYEVVRPWAGINYPFRIEVADMIHFRDGIDPDDPRLGLSGILLILREIFGDSQVADYYTKLVGNGGVPPYVLSIDNKISMLKPEDLAKIKADLALQAKRASAEPLVITGASAHKLGYSPTELDLQVQRYLGEQRFSAVTGIPSEVLQLGSGKEHSIYSNVQEAKRDAAQGYLVPTWWYIAEELTNQSLPDYDNNQQHYVEHDTSEVQALQEDETDKHKRVNSDFQNGVITRAEARMDLGRTADTNEQGTGTDDVYFIRTNSTFIGKNEMPPKPQPKGPGKTDNVPTADDENLPKGKTNGQSEVLAA